MTEKQNTILNNNSPLDSGLKGNLKSRYRDFCRDLYRNFSNKKSHCNKFLGGKFFDSEFFGNKIFNISNIFNTKVNNKFLSKKKSAQHIVEFVLFTPFLIAFIGVVLEITYSFNTNYKFNNAVYEAINYVTSKNKINTSKDDTIDLIEKTARYNMYKNMTPYSDTLKVYLTQTGELDFIVATYTYTSTFTLVNTFFHVVPDMYNYKTVIPLNSAILRGNNYSILNENLEGAFVLYYESFNQTPDETKPDETPQGGITPKETTP